MLWKPLDRVLDSDPALEHPGTKGGWEQPRGAIACYTRFGVYWAKVGQSLLPKHTDETGLTVFHASMPSFISLFTQHFWGTPVCFLFQPCLGPDLFHTSMRPWQCACVSPSGCQLSLHPTGPVPLPPFFTSSPPVLFSSFPRPSHSQIKQLPWGLVSTFTLDNKIVLLSALSNCEFLWHLILVVNLVTSGIN